LSNSLTKPPVFTFLDRNMINRRQGGWMKDLTFFREFFSTDVKLLNH
jgi:hypothetical protein